MSVVHRHHIDLSFDTRRLFGLMMAFRGLNRGPFAANASQTASLVAHLALSFYAPFLIPALLFVRRYDRDDWVYQCLWTRDEVLLMSSIRVHLLS